jgi:hypothetical protein
MAYYDAETYRERERHWRAEAAKLSASRDRETCLALAEGYSNLVQIIERMHGPRSRNRQSDAAGVAGRS